MGNAVNGRLPIKQTGYSLLRVWIAFSISSVVVSAVFCVWDGDNPLRSDDPYIIGFLAGASTAIISLCWVVATWIGSSPLRRHCAYFAPLALMVFSLALWDVAWPPVEGQGLPTLLAIAVAGGGFAAYPFHLLKFGNVWPVVASSLGVLLLLGYLGAVVSMSFVGFQ